MILPEFRDSFKQTQKAPCPRKERDETVTAYTFQHKAGYLENDRDLAIADSRFDSFWFIYIVFLGL